MRKIEINVYNFDELDESVKMVVIDNFREQEQAIRSNDLSCYLNDILENDYNLKGIEIDYSLTYSQGDGVCFYGENNILSYTILKNGDFANANAFEKYILNNYKGVELEKILDYLNLGNEIKIEKTSYRYSHLNTCEFIYHFDCDNYRINEVLEDLCDNLKIYVYNPICKELERLGYEYLNVSDDDVINLIKDNNIEFYQDGSIFKEEF